MVHAESAAVTHWTQFGAASVPVDWSDHHVAHKTVMRLFDPDLGPQPRATGGILFRLDPAADGSLSVLVQSRVAPVLLPASARSIVFDEDRWRIDDSAVVRLRVAVNPIYRTGRVENVRSADESLEWTRNRLSTCLGDVDVVNWSRNAFTTRGKHDKMTVDTFDAVATVVDAADFDAMRRDGVGRRKAYGSGLLTAQRIA